MIVTSFAELARTVAANWKSAKNETREYCVEVARILKERHTELTKVGEICCLSTIDSVSPGPTEEARPRNVDNETKDTDLNELGAVFCLPTMDSVSPCPKNETNQRKGMYRADNISPVAREQGTANSQQFTKSTKMPTIIPPVTHEQGAMNNCDNSRTSMMDSYQQYQHNRVATIPNATSMWRNESHDHSNTKTFQPMPSMHHEYQHDRAATIPNAKTMWGDDTIHSRDSSRTWLMDMFHQYQHNQVATIPNATTIRGNNSLNCTTINMLQPTPSDVIQEMQLMTGSARSQTGRHHQEVRQEFRAIMNASRRASISNMMTLPGRAPMPHGIRCFGEQPNPISRRYTAPGRQHLSEQERSTATYDIQELDVDDSNILDMWRSSKVQETHEF
jgi:hypothetical protein